MKIPESVEAVIAEFDDALKPFQWHELRSALIKASAIPEGEAGKELALGAWSEIAAWSLQPGRYKSWNRYFGPLSSWRTVEDKVLFDPDISKITADVHEHWAQRGGLCKHPCLKARYYDLAWEFADVVGKKRNYKDAIGAVDQYLRSLNEGYLKLQDQVLQVIRALDLACTVRDQDRIASTRDALFKLHFVSAAEGKFWWKTFDRLIQRDALLSAEARNELIASLELLAAQYSDNSDGTKFNPHHLESIAKKLLPIYQKEGKRVEANRLSKLVGEAFEYIASRGNAMQAAAFLQIAENSYRESGLAEDSKRARLARIQAIEKSRDEMHSVTVTQRIPREHTDDFLKAVIGDTIGNTFAQIALQFVWRLDELERLVKETAKTSPIFAMMPVQVMASDHQAATIGGVEDDLDGRMCQQAVQSVQLDSFFLHLALDAAISKFNLGPHEIVGFAGRTNLFDDLTFLYEGVRGWFGGDYFKSIFLLTPQIEHGLRKLAGNLGEAVTRRHPTMPNREVAIGIGDILANAKVKETLGAALSLYFKVIYSDPRGLNLRNAVAHGLVESRSINSLVANLQVHTLLVMGFWPEIAKYHSDKAKS